jgi:hypothetical protein
MPILPRRHSGVKHVGLRPASKAPDTQLDDPTAVPVESKRSHGDCMTASGVEE